jgi:hypothetical protein
VRDLVSAYRIVTLTGVGGIGKTSLAIETARDLVSDFDDGGWFVELASLSNPDLVSSTVASALGLKLSGEISAESIARAVGAKHLLLVLDNCQHVIDAAANLAERLLRSCPHIGFLVTSREVLRIDGEKVYRVPPLDVPAPGQETPDHILGHSAVELFIAKINALGVVFSPRAEELTSIAAICRHLDGIPLAIEFAAASAATPGIAAVATGLRDRFALLTSGRRTALARHRTLRATLDWGYDLLPEAEQQLFRCLAVFNGGFTLDAAVAVLADTGLNAANATGPRCATRRIFVTSCHGQRWHPTLVFPRPTGRTAFGNETTFARRSTGASQLRGTGLLASDSAQARSFGFSLIRESECWTRRAASGNRWNCSPRTSTPRYFLTTSCEPRPRRRGTTACGPGLRSLHRGVWDARFARGESVPGRIAGVTHAHFRGHGKVAWFGWATDAKMGPLYDSWFEVPDVAARKKICQEIMSNSGRTRLTFRWECSTSRQPSTSGSPRCPKVGRGLCD